MVMEGLLDQPAGEPDTSNPKAVKNALAMPVAQNFCSFKE
jgi:hypothetical protein